MLYRCSYTEGQKKKGCRVNEKQTKMTERNISELTDQELLDEAKKMKSFSITNALFIGFLGGIILYSVFKNSWGMLTLIPLYFIYKMVNDPKNKRAKELETALKQRNLKTTNT